MRYIQVLLYHPDTNTTTMSHPYLPPPRFSPEPLLKIVENLRDNDGGLRYGDFNSFLQINSTLYDHLNCKLWKDAAG
jgi:ankyrin repeat protein